MVFEVASEFKDLFADKPPFQVALSLQGEVFRELEQRRTLKFEYKGQPYFIKIHFGISVGEVIKNFSQLKKPVLGASNEWFALNHLRANGVTTAKPIAYYDDMAFATQRKSFVIMSSIENFVDLGNLAKKTEWLDMKPAERKRIVIAVARLARKIHQAGIHHRDFYLCHILLQSDWLEGSRQIDPDLTIIDLHRSTYHKVVPNSKKIKDIGSLYYSALIDANLSSREALLFIKYYSNTKSVAEELRRNCSMWQAVQRKALSIFKRDYGTRPKVNLPNV